MRGGFSRPLPPLVLIGRETTNTIVRVAFVAHGFYVIEGRGLYWVFFSVDESSRPRRERFSFDELGSSRGEKSCRRRVVP